MQLGAQRVLLSWRWRCRWHWQCAWQLEAASVVGPFSLGDERQVVAAPGAWLGPSWAGSAQAFANANGPTATGYAVIERNAALHQGGTAYVVSVVVAFKGAQDVGPPRASCCRECFAWWWQAVAGCAP